MSTVGGHSTPAFASRLVLTLEGMLTHVYSYTRTRSTRVFLCAASADESGREALEWSLEVSLPFFIAASRGAWCLPSP